MTLLSDIFSHYTGAGAAGLSHLAVMLIDAVLVFVVVFCAITDTKTGKILNKVTFPAMLVGILLNSGFGGGRGFAWALAGWFVGMAIQWIPFTLGFAKAGDVKLLAAVGALKGWAFCLFGFLYGAAAFGFMLVPWLAMRGELGSATNTIRNYFTLAAITHSAPDAPEPTVKRRYVPWGVGLATGFLIALALEIMRGRATPW